MGAPPTMIELSRLWLLVAPMLRTAAGARGGVHEAQSKCCYTADTSLLSPLIIILCVSNNSSIGRFNEDFLLDALCALDSTYVAFDQMPILELFCSSPLSYKVA